MTNAQSLGNKFEDIEVVFGQNSVDVGVVTESWFSKNMPENQLDINNYNLFSKHREEKGGGGVAIYVKEDIPASHIDSIIVPSELECLWVKIRPKKLPRSISAIAVCAVYITTNSPLQPLLMEHLLSSVDHLRSRHPDIGILITGDFNRMNMFQLINGNDLSQIVDFPTRGKATLDLMLTSGNLRECYEKPYLLSPLGLSDHSCVIWKPKHHRVAKCEHKAQITRPLLESGMRKFGSWIQSLDWHQVLEATSTQKKADAFYEILDLGMNTCFPEKKKRVHSNDKSWITPTSRT